MLTNRNRDVKIQKRRVHPSVPDPKPLGSVTSELPGSVLICYGSGRLDAHSQFQDILIYSKAFYESKIRPPKIFVFLVAAENF